MPGGGREGRLCANSRTRRRERVQSASLPPRSAWLDGEAIMLEKRAGCVRRGIGSSPEEASEGIRRWKDSSEGVRR